MVGMLIVSLGFHGCAGIYSVVEFEVLEPATVSFPDHVNQLLIMNRSPFNLNVISEEDRAGMSKEHLVILDTAISNSLNRGLYNMLQQSPIQSFHQPIYIKSRQSDTTLLEELYLTKREVSDLCSQWGGDAIISLELYKLDVDEDQITYADDPGLAITHFYQISNEVHWNIYLPESPRPFDTYTMKDTLYFTDLLDGQWQPVPDVLGMIRELFYHTGTNYGRYLVPVWTRASRLLYKGKGDSLKLASIYTDQGEWEKAYSVWKGLLDSEDSTMVSKAYHNLAIYYELEDKLDSADYLAGMAMTYDTLEVVRDYKEELETRIMNRWEILKQVQ
jgi:hypothetical protein